MSLGDLADGSVSSWLVQACQGLPLVFHDVINFNCGCVLEFGGGTDGTASRQDEVVFKKANGNIEPLDLHGGHLVIHESLIQSIQVTQRHILDVAANYVNETILSLAR